MTSARAWIETLALGMVLTVSVPLGVGAAVVSSSEAPTQGTSSPCAEAERMLATTRGLPIHLCTSIPEPTTTGPAEAPPIPVSAGPCNPNLERCEAWVSAPYDGPAAGNDYVGQRATAVGNLAGNAVATTMDGKLVFTAGASEREGAQWAVATLAYDASDGARLWVETLEPAGGATELNAVSVVGGTDAVFVTGYALEDGEGTGFTHAYDAASGTTLWHQTFPGWANHSAISEDSSHVFVAGDARLANGQMEGRIVSYDAVTGEQVWVRSITDPKGWPVMPWRIDAQGDRVSAAISRFVPDGPEAGVTKSVIVATYDATGPDEGTLVSKVSVPTNGAIPAGITLSGNGSAAFVAQSARSPIGPDALTYVFGVDTAAGELAWNNYFLGWDPNGTLPTNTYPWHYQPIEMSPKGSVILSAYSVPYRTTGTFVTASLDAETGHEEWTVRELTPDLNIQTPGWYGPTVSVNPKTGQVVMAGAMLIGNRLRPVTFGYSPTGQREWMRISNEPPQGSTLPVSEGHWPALVHSPDGTRVFEAGVTMAVHNDPASSPDVIVAAFDTAV